MRALISALGLLLGCGGGPGAALSADLARAGDSLAAPPTSSAERGERPPAIDGSLESYVALGLRESPEVRAGFERWRAATLRIGGARTPPDPVLTYAFYASPVETRVGPQRHRVSLRQTIPWPTRLSGAASARTASALAAQRTFEARALAVRARIAEAWWGLWRTRRVSQILGEQASVLEALADAVRGRVAVDRATLAEVAQIELSRARLLDRVASLAAEERSQQAALRAAVGVDLAACPTTGELPPSGVGEAEQALREAVRAHPRLLALARRAEARDAQSAAAEGARFPSLTVGLDWIETGAAQSPVDGSGRDAVVLSLGVSVPLYQGAIDGVQRAAAAEAAAERAAGRSAEDAALAALSGELAAVRDARRRVELHRSTLLPQARAAYESVVGAYTVGRGSVAATLLAQRDLLELALDLADAWADHGRAWARLERVGGRPVARAATAGPARTAAGGG
ncbi:MAG: TolC family protein [Sandaracinaceae bacterium]